MVSKHLCRWQDYRHPGSQGEQYFLGLEQSLKGSGNPSYPGKPSSSCCVEGVAYRIFAWLSSVCMWSRCALCLARQGAF